MTGQRPARPGYETQATRLLEDECGDVAARQLAAIRAVGYAVLSLRDHLGDQFSDLSDAVVAVADQVGDLAVPVDRLAGNAGVVRPAGKGPGKSAVMHDHLRRFLRRHPRAVISVVDLKGTKGADLPVRGPEFVLSGAALATVRQALADAAEWRQRVPDGACGCGEYREDARCPDNFGDEQLAAAYADLLVRLLACLGGGDVS